MYIHFTLRSLYEDKSRGFLTDLVRTFGVCLSLLFPEREERGNSIYIIFILIWIFIVVEMYDSLHSARS